MKKLPKLFKNEEIDAIDHNKKSVHLKEDNTSIEETLNTIFNGFHHPYNIKVKIKTKDKDYNTYLISYNNDKIVTLDNEVILVKEIISIQIIK